MPIKEEEFRAANWNLMKTAVRERAEIDVYCAPELPGIEIRVRLAEDIRREMSFHSLSIIDAEGSAVELIGDEGLLRDENAEVVAWELLEGMPEVDHYLNGRAPADMNGERARPGTIILRPNEPAEESPELF